MPTTPLGEPLVPIPAQYFSDEHGAPARSQSRVSTLHAVQRAVENGIVCRCLPGRRCAGKQDQRQPACLDQRSRTFTGATGGREFAFMIGTHSEMAGRVVLGRSLHWHHAAPMS